MGEIVDLKPVPIEDDELVENLARFADGTLTEAQVRARHRLSNADWSAMGEIGRPGASRRGGEIAPAPHRRHQARIGPKRGYFWTADPRQADAGPKYQRQACD